jgi:hypothetical protein
MHELISWVRAARQPISRIERRMAELEEHKLVV